MTNKVKKSFSGIEAANIPPAAVSFFSEEVIKKVEEQKAEEKKAASYVPEPVKEEVKTVKIKAPTTRKAREQRSKRMSLFVSPTMYEAVNAAAADMDLSTNSYINLVLKMALEGKSKESDE